MANFTPRTDRAQHRTALVVGASGITGSAIVEQLAAQDWDVVALSRTPVPGSTARHVSADLRSAERLTAALAEERPTHVFFTAWSRQATEKENVEVNAGMLRNLLAALGRAPMEHVALMTGLKHYLGPFEAYNVVNGDVFRWRRMWPALAEWFGLEWEGFQDAPRPLEEQMRGTEDVWARIVAEHGLVDPELARVASWWHTDADLGRPIEVVADMSKSRLAGFPGYRRTEDCFVRLFERYRAEHVIPR